MFKQNPFEAQVSRGKSPISALGMTTPHEHESPGKIFMKAGKTIYDNILKTVIPGKAQADALASILSKYRFFGWTNDDHRKIEKINNLMLLWGAVHGRASFFALEAMNQVISEKLSAAVSGIPITQPPPEEREREADTKKKETQ